MGGAAAAPLARVNGMPVALEEAVAAAADTLVGARLPLVYGLVETTVEAQRLAVEIADLAGGAVDTAASAGHEASLLAFQRIGQITTTLGEVRARADLVVFWGVDPDAREPGFQDHYIARAPDSPARVRVAVDIGDARGPEGVEERITVPAAAEFEALWALRAMVRGRRVDVERLASLGVSPDHLRSLARRLVSCRYGVILHDADPPPERRDPLRALALGSLVEDANEKARVRLIGIRKAGNSVGAEAVLTWQTGYPCAVHFGRGYPRYGPGEYTGAALLAPGGADAVLLVGADPARHLTPAQRQRLAEIPSVIIGPAAERVEGARVAVVTAPLQESPGGVYRLDGVALHRRVETTQLTDAAVLADLAAAVRARVQGVAVPVQHSKPDAAAVRARVEGGAA
jgi:formylmethanofuran dehydrogenase subunit B